MYVYIHDIYIYTQYKNCIYIYILSQHGNNHIGREAKFLAKPPTQFVESWHLCMFPASWKKVTTRFAKVSTPKDTKRLAARD